jgi:rubrerythrin
MGILSVGSSTFGSRRGSRMLDEARRLDTSEGDFVEFRTTGSLAAGAYHCSGCGYGVTVQASLPRCPMCSGTTWEPAGVSSFAAPELQ